MRGGRGRVGGRWGGSRGMGAMGRARARQRDKNEKRYCHSGGRADEEGSNGREGFYQRRSEALGGACGGMAGHRRPLRNGPRGRANVSHPPAWVAPFRYRTRWTAPHGGRRMARRRPHDARPLLVAAGATAAGEAGVASGAASRPWNQTGEPRPQRLTLVATRRSARMHEQIKPQGMHAQKAHSAGQG